jgi:asparagine synthase (glutamine-hydrolysing)
MCGFAGVVAWDEKYRVSRDTLEKMSARIAHRGPDGQGLYLNHDQQITPDRPQVGLVHRRLAILDLDPRANQPFTDNQGRWIVFNGEIYNFRELRAELTKLKPDYAWRTTGDTEVLLVAYDVWGEKCVEHLNGMFAFAVWDEPARTLFLARDRMGQKPFYVSWLQRDGRWPHTLDYHDAPRLPAVVAFASELPAVSELPWVDRSVDVPYLTMYLSLGYISQGTIYRGVRELRPAARLRFSPRDGGAYDQSYYFWPSASSKVTVEAPQETSRFVREAVRRQLVSDVPVGCFLSGGVDSSVVAASMKAAGADVRTYTVGFDDARYDESEYARRVAKMLGTRHQEFRVQPNAAADLPQLAATFGQPFGDSSALPAHYLARETRQFVKVALSGDGGDELFGGYDRYRAMALAEKMDRLPKRVGAIAASASWQAIPGSHPKSRWTRAKRFIKSLSLPPDQRYAQYVRLFETSLINKLLKEGLRDRQDDADSLVGLLGAYLHQLEVVPAVMLLDRMTYLPGDLLAKVDHCSMLHALEVRSPFMDHELVQFAAGLTTDQLLKGGPKRMLREAFAQDLPAWVFKRKKMGFAVPIGEWFRGELRAMLRDNLFASDSFANQHFNTKVVQRLVDEHEQERVDHSQRLYALLMLELWWRTSRS